MGRKQELERAVALGKRAERELERLSALPDLGALGNGTVLAVAIRFVGGRQPYVYVGIKEQGYWYFTGNGPNKATDADAAEWMARSGRRVVDIRILAELELATLGMTVVELDASLLASLIDRPVRASSLNAMCMVPNCRCIGDAHP